MASRNSFAESARKKTQEVLALEGMKKGKTNEQCRVIDFFLKTEQGGCLNRNSSSSNLSLDEYLNLVQSKCDALNSRQRAIVKIGLDESQIQEIEPIVLSSFIYDSDVLVRYDTQFTVSSQYSISWIFFSASQIYTYQYIFDLTSDETWEFTNDFFYTDITCFSTSRHEVERIESSFLGGGCLKGQKENVDKYIYVVDALEIVVPNKKYSFSMRNSDTMETSIQAAKQMLREKKYA